MTSHRNQEGRIKRDEGGSDVKKSDRKDKNKEYEKGHKKPPCPPPPQRRPLTVQKVALIAALLCEWLRIESVIVSRNKNVQVILGGDFSNFLLQKDLFNDQLLAENIGLFEALDETGLFENPAEEAAAIGFAAEEAEGLGGIDTRTRDSHKKRKLKKRLPNRGASNKKKMQ